MSIASINGCIVQYFSRQRSMMARLNDVRFSLFFKSFKGSSLMRLPLSLYLSLVSLLHLGTLVFQ